MRKCICIHLHSEQQAGLILIIYTACVGKPPEDFPRNKARLCKSPAGFRSFRCRGAWGGGEGVVSHVKDHVVCKTIIQADAGICFQQLTAGIEFNNDVPTHWLEPFEAHRSTSAFVCWFAEQGLRVSLAFQITQIVPLQCESSYLSFPSVSSVQE